MSTVSDEFAIKINQTYGAIRSITEDEVYYFGDSEVWDVDVSMRAVMLPVALNELIAGFICRIDETPAALRVVWGQGLDESALMDNTEVHVIMNRLQFLDAISIFPIMDGGFLDTEKLKLGVLLFDELLRSLYAMGDRFSNGIGLAHIEPFSSQAIRYALLSDYEQVKRFSDTYFFDGAELDLEDSNHICVQVIYMISTNHSLDEIDALVSVLKIEWLRSIDNSTDGITFVRLFCLQYLVNRHSNRDVRFESIIYELRADSVIRDVQRWS